jgi:CRISPR system Cascade subunit CasC
MTTPRFVQIHSLIAYSAALLNRDDSGLAKRLPFGRATRTRISSQCLKRHWRMGDDDWALKSLPSLTALDFATRSRDLFSRAIVEPLVEEGFDRDLLEAISSEIQVALKVKKAGKGKSSGGGW